MDGGGPWEIKNAKDLMILLKKIINLWPPPKENRLFLVMPNATVVVKNGNADFYHFNAQVSFVKKISDDQFFQKEKRESQGIFFHRGSEDPQRFSLEDNIWYEIDPKGLGLAPVENPRTLGLLERPLVRNIPTILIARELLLKRHSRFLFDSSLAREQWESRYGYRLWDANVHESGTGELDQREAFLKRLVERNESFLLSKTSFDGERTIHFPKYGSDHETLPNITKEIQDKFKDDPTETLWKRFFFKR